MTFEFSIISGTGVGLFYEGGSGTIMNNSFIPTNTDKKINNLTCLSGSFEAGVGVWLDPNGTDVTLSSSNFKVTVGDMDNPGSIQIAIPMSSDSFASSQTGVYTCKIPDETGEIQTLFIGIYLIGNGGRYSMILPTIFYSDTCFQCLLLSSP